MEDLKIISSFHLCLIIFYIISFPKNLYAWQDEHSPIADEYYGKAKQFGDANQFDSSIYYYQKALMFYEDDEDWQGIVLSCKGLGACYTWLARFELAAEFLDKGLSVALEKNEKDSTIVELYQGIGFYHGRLGDYEKQLHFYEKALQMSQEVKEINHQKIAECHNNLGASYLYKGKYEKAIMHLQAGREILEATSSGNTALSNIYNNLGTVYIKQGDNENALRYYLKALDVANTNIKEIEVALCYNNIGKCYENKGELDMSFDYYNRSLDALRLSFKGEHYYTGILNNNLGVLSRTRKKYDDALSYFVQAQNIIQDQLGENHSYEALIHVNMAETYDEQGNAEETLKHLEKALSIQQKTLSTYHPEIAITLNHLGNYYYKKKEVLTALTFYQKALTTLVADFTDADINTNPALLEIKNSKVIVLEVLKNKAHALEKLYRSKGDVVENLEAALFTYQIGTELIDTICFEFNSEDAKQELINNSFPLYEGGIKTAHMLYNITGDEKYLHQAFIFSEKSKAFLLLQAIKKTKDLQFAGVPDSLMDIERNLKVDIAFYEREQYLAKRQQDSTKISQYQNYLFQFTSALDSLHHRIEEAYPKYYRLTYARKLPEINDIQKTLLNEKTVLLDYFVGDSTINIFCLSKDALNMYAYRKPMNFKSLVEDFKKSVEDAYFIEESSAQADDLYIHSASQLYKILLQEPIESTRKPVQKLIIIPSGILGYVNFEAFLSKLPSDLKQFRYNDLAYLVKSYDIQYLYSAATFYNSKQTLNAVSSKGMSIFGGFAVEDISLPGAVREVLRIAEITDGDAKIGEEATERNYKDIAGNYILLHLSMHAFLDDDTPLYSKLVFTQSQDSIEDDSLTVAEIYNMQLNAQLAVLSACETGAGTLSRGEGIMSLSRAFAYAGCPSVVTSLWQVESKNASALMVEFYKNLKQGLPKDQSLRLAKLNYLTLTDDPLLSHPHYWLSFIFTGDSVPVKFTEDYIPWLELSIILGIIVLSFFLWKKRTQLNAYLLKKVEFSKLFHFF